MIQKQNSRLDNIFNKINQKLEVPYDGNISQDIINTFMQAVAESSIDCSLHHPKLDDIIKEKINCKLCSPDNSQLFHPLLKTDMELPSNCRPFSEKKVQVEEIILPGNPEKFYYKKENDKIKIYSFNKKLNGYAPLLRTHPMYADLMEAILLK